MGTLPDLTDALVGVAELAPAEGRPELAKELLLMVEMYSAVAHETRQQAQTLQATTCHPLCRAEHRHSG